MPPAAERARKEQSLETPIPDLEKQWRRETHKGNEAFSSGDYEAAAALFSEALARARRLFIRAAADQFSPRKAAHILIVSQHNIAETFMRQGMFEEAYTHYLSAFSTLCDWLEASNAPESMRRACAEKLTEAMNAVVTYLRRTSAEPQHIEAIYTRAAQHGPAATH